MPDRDDRYRLLRERYAELISNTEYTTVPRERIMASTEWLDCRHLIGRRPLPFEEFARRLRHNHSWDEWRLFARNRAHTAPYFTPLYETTLSYPVTEYTVARLRDDGTGDTRESRWYIAEELALMYGYYLYCHTRPAEGGSR
jgi:hypothetical protein